MAVQKLTRAQREHSPFGTVAAAVMMDETLSSDARFLIAMTSVLPPDWDFYVRWLNKKTGWGRSKLQLVMRELEAAGLLVRVRHHTAGRYEWEYRFKMIKQGADFQSIEFQPLEKQAIEIQALENQPINKEKKKPTKNEPTNTTTKRGRRVVETETGLHVEEFDLDEALARELDG